MKALLVDEQIEYRKVDKPSKRKGYILIKVLMAGICRTDIYVGKKEIAVQTPRILGHEFCGLVENDGYGFKKGDLVTVNPLFEDLSFLGIDYDGCFAEYVAIPKDQVFKIKTNNYKLAAYIEPIAASLAPLNTHLPKNQVIYVYGSSRIAKLTDKILKLSGYNSKIIKKGDKKENSCDFIVETEMNEESIEEIQKIIKKNGTLILKSRYPKKIAVNLYSFVKKDIKIQGCYYYDFKKSIKFALKHESFFNELFGKSFKLEEYNFAFLEDLKADKKVFLEF